MSRAEGVSDAVYRYLVAHRNSEVHYNDIAEATGFTPMQVMGSVHHLKSGTKTQHTIESPRRGWYVYRGTKNGEHAVVPHKAKAEVVALLADGRLLVSVEGRVYVAVELDV